MSNVVGNGYHKIGQEILEETSTRQLAEMYGDSGNELLQVLPNQALTEDDFAAWSNVPKEHKQLVIELMQMPEYSFLVDAIADAERELGSPKMGTHQVEGETYSGHIDDVPATMRGKQIRSY